MTKKKSLVIKADTVVSENHIKFNVQGQCFYKKTMGLEKD